MHRHNASTIWALSRPKTVFCQDFQPASAGAEKPDETISSGFSRLRIGSTKLDSCVASRALDVFRTFGRQSKLFAATASDPGHKDTLMVSQQLFAVDQEAGFVGFAGGCLVTSKNWGSNPFSNAERDRDVDFTYERRSLTKQSGL